MDHGDHRLPVKIHQLISDLQTIKNLKWKENVNLPAFPYGLLDLSGPVVQDFPNATVRHIKGQHEVMISLQLVNYFINNFNTFSPDGPTGPSVPLSPGRPWIWISGYEHFLFKVFHCEVRRGSAYVWMLPLDQSFLHRSSLLSVLGYPASGQGMTQTFTWSGIWYIIKFIIIQVCIKSSYTLGPIGPRSPGFPFSPVSP